jgi:hypothetical protein
MSIPIPVETSDLWLPVSAVVIGCRPSWSRAGGGETYSPGEYVVTFAYEVLGKEYRGWYFAGSPREEGKTFEILYDPRHPKRNTGSEYRGSIWMKAAALIFGGCLAAFLIWLQHKIS